MIGIILLSIILFLVFPPLGVIIFLLLVIIAGMANH